MECGWDPFGSGSPKTGSRIRERWADLRLSETCRTPPKSPPHTEEMEIERPSTSAAASRRRSRVYNKYNKAPQKNVKCLVDNCEFDINKCRDYHRRHRVCETHSKTAVVRVKGKPQRFCQQCSRFHSLDEFDEYKRSCRRRLDGHNRRRRKPHHPPPLYLASDYAGPRLLQFGTPPSVSDLYGNVNPYLSMMWPAAEHTTFNRFTPILPKIEPQTQLGSLAERQIPAVMHPNVNELGFGMMNTTESAPAPATATTNVTEEMNSCHDQKVHRHPDYALYLLSALQEQNSSEYDDHVIGSMNCHKCLCSESSAIEEEAADHAPSLTPPDVNMNSSTANNNLHYNEMPQMGMDYGLMEDGGISSFTFPYALE